MASSTPGEGLGGAVRLGNLGVGEVLDRPHLQRGQLRLPDGIVQEQQAHHIRCRLVDAAPRPGAEQAVAAAEVVIQEAERRADREGVQPERDLGQLDRHRVLVDAVDAALEDHAPDDVAVVEPVPVDGPVAVLRVRHDPVADGLDAAHERRDIALYQRFRLGHGRDHSVGEIVDQTDQEVPGPHGRVADLQLKDLLGRVERCEPRNRPLTFWFTSAGTFAQLRPRRRPCASCTRGSMVSSTISPTRSSGV